MTAASFANADVQDIVDKLTTEEAISLIAGVGFWGTAAVSLQQPGGRSKLHYTLHA